jgi:hypothetical protein
MANTKYDGEAESGYYSDVDTEKNVRATEAEVARVIAIVVAIFGYLSIP